MKNTPGYASLPARFASIEDSLTKSGALEVMGPQGFFEELFMSRYDALKQ